MVQTHISQPGDLSETQADHWLEVHVSGGAYSEMTWARSGQKWLENLPNTERTTLRIRGIKLPANLPINVEHVNWRTAGWEQ